MKQKNLSNIGKEILGYLIFLINYIIKENEKWDILSNTEINNLMKCKKQINKIK